MMLELLTRWAVDSCAGSHFLTEMLSPSLWLLAEVGIYNDESFPRLLRLTIDQTLSELECKFGISR